MLEEVVSDYATYLKLDVTNGFQNVQDVIDNMLTRLEELNSVLQMVKLKNSECNTIVTEDIGYYRTEINKLSKKITTVNQVALSLHNNVQRLEEQVDKAEKDFGVNNDSKIKTFLKPFMKRSKDTNASNIINLPCKIMFESVLNNFEETHS